MDCCRGNWARQTALTSLCLVSLVACTRTSQPTPRIDVTAPVEGALSGGEQYSSNFACRQGQILLVRAQQIDVDFTLQVADAGGSAMVSVDSPAERFGHETVVLRCPQSSAHSVTLTSKQKDVPGGRFNLEIQVLDPAAPELTAYETLSEAGRLSRDQSWDAAAELLTSAATQWRQLEREDELAEAEYLAGALKYLNMSRWREAVEHARRAHALYSELNNLDAQEDAAILLGGALEEAAKGTATASAAESSRWLDESEKYLTWAANSSAKRGRGFAAAMARVYIAINYYYRDDLLQTTSMLQRAESELAALREEPMRKRQLQNLAFLLCERGAYAEARTAFERLLPVMGSDDPYARASALHNSAEANRLLGYFDVALAQELESLELQKARNDKAGIARSLQALGYIYLRVGQQARAIEFLEQALAQARATDQGRFELAALVALGEALRDSGNVARAFDLHQQAARNVTKQRSAAAAKSATSAAQAMQIAMALGTDLLMLGRLPEALENFTAAVAQAKLPAMRHQLARALTQQARTLLAAHRVKDAEMAAEQAVAAGRSSGDLPDQAAALTVKAQIEREMQRDTAALVSARQARALYEKLRDRAVSPRVRAAMLVNRRTAFELEVELLARDGMKSQPDMLEALLVADSYHARSLLEGLSATRLDSSGAANAERERLYSEAAGYDKALSDLLDSDAAPAARIEALRTQIASVLARIDVLEGRSTVRTSPAQLDTEAFAALQARLQADQHLVEFFSGEQRSWAWIVSRSSLTAVQLPANRVIRSLVDRARQTLTKPSALPATQAAMRALSEAVIAPLVPHLKGKRLLIVADGPLLYVPFQQLLPPAGRSEFEHALVPSLSALVVPASEGAGKSSRAAVFSQSQTTDDAALPAVELEVAAINTAFGPEQVTAIRGAALNRAAFKSFSFSGYDVVHIASHAENDPTDASLSRLLIGRSADDVLLASDINLLRIPVPLVILSGCETALGTDLPGNGVGGFAQAFMVAGAETVIASLWNIPDAAAAELMKHFYAALTAAPSRPQRALAAAQAALRQSSQWSHPFYWSGFVTITRVLK